MASDTGEAHFPEIIQRQIRSLVDALDQPNHPADPDLTLSQWRALITIGEHPSSAINAVGKRLGIGLPASSLLVDRLVQSGLVNRNRSTKDRRLVLCSLTESGRTLYQLITQRQRQLKSWLDQMDPEDLKALSRGLTALSEASQQRISPKEGYH